MKRYAARRIIIYLISVFVIITLNFLLPRMMPGDPVSTFLGNLEEQYGPYAQYNTEVIIAYYKEQFGLDGTLWEQYTSYWWNLFQGKLGVSFMSFPLDVSTIISHALPYTLSLVGTAAITSWILGNLFGAFIGWRGGKFDTIVTPIAMALSQIPYYFLALVFVFAFIYAIPLFPRGVGAYDPYVTPGLNLPFIVSYLSYMALPCLSIIVASLPGWLIRMRAIIVQLHGEEYTKLAVAKGLKKNYILMRYALRNALLPQTAHLAFYIGNILSGALLTEVIFGYPGIGWVLRNALATGDYNLLQGVLLISSVTVLTSCLVMDFLYPLIDPRVTYRGE